MKTCLKIILLMTALLSLVGCSQKVSEKELFVTGSFAYTATSFAGGLVVRGAKVGGGPGETFIRSVAASGSVKVTLPDGLWDISVVGWNPPEADILEGVPECGKTVVDFGPNNTNAMIAISAANCKNEEFSGVVGGTASVYPLIVVTCGSFYEHDDPLVPNPLKVISDLTDKSFCNNIYHPLDLKSEVRSIKVELLHKDIGSAIVPAPGVSSICRSDFDHTQSLKGVFELGSRMIPVKNVPLKVTLFKEDVCANPGRASESKIADYILGGGVKGGAPNADTILNSKSEGSIPPVTFNRLFLPSSDTKRGFSAFYELMPSFKCNGDFCLQPEVGFDYYVQSRVLPTQKETQFVIDQQPSGATCNPAVVTLESWGKVGSGLWTGSAGAAVISQLQISSAALTINAIVESSCHNKVIEKSIRLSVADSVELPDWFEFMYMGATKKVKILKEENAAEMFHKTWDLTGSPANRPQGGHLKSLDDKHDDTYGALSFARDMLGPKGIGGFYPAFDPASAVSQKDLCLAVSGERIASFVDKGVSKTYKLNINSIEALSSPTFYDDGSASHYTKRARVCQLLASGACPQMLVMDFSCEKKSGKINEVNNEISSTEQRFEKNLLVWNIDHSTSPRFERYYSERNLNPVNGALLSQYSSFDRVMKQGDGTPEVSGVSYSKEKLGAVDLESASRYFMTATTDGLGWQAHIIAPVANMYADPGLTAILDVTAFTPASFDGCLTPADPLTPGTCANFSADAQDVPVYYIAPELFNIASLDPLGDFDDVFTRAVEAATTINASATILP